MEPLTPTGEKLMVPKVSFQGEQVVSQARPNRPQGPSKKDAWGLGQRYSPSSLPPTWCYSGAGQTFPGLSLASPQPLVE